MKVFDYIKPQSPRITISCKVNLQNFESLGISVESNSSDECLKIISETLDSLAKNSEVTRDMIQAFKRRVLE